MDKTGMTLLSPPGSDTLYAYYIDDNSMMVEVSYDDGSWSKNYTHPSKTSNVTTLSSNSTTPIAAVAYTLSGDTAYVRLHWSLFEKCANWYDSDKSSGSTVKG